MADESRQSVNPYQVTPACERGGPPPRALVHNESSTLAIVSMALGIAALGGFLSCGLLILLGPVAVILGHLARKELRERPALKGAGMATAGLITGYISTALLVLALVAVIVAIAVDGGVVD